MANYTAADVKRLRELTGSGMLDCKNALADNDGDFDKAVEQLRIKGAKDVGKRAERSTAEGLVVAKDGVLIEINSETDFVAKNDEFQALADTGRRPRPPPRKPADVDALKAARGRRQDGRRARPGARPPRSARSSSCVASSPSTARLPSYLHKRASDLPPSVGVLVEYTGEGDAAAEAARGAAMQVAALKAKYVTRDEVPADIVAAERRIAEQTAARRASPRLRSRRSSKAASTASTRTSCSPSSPRSRTRRRPSRRFSTRPASRSSASCGSRSAPARCLLLDPARLICSAGFEVRQGTPTGTRTAAARAVRRRANGHDTACRLAPGLGSTGSMRQD